MPIEWLLFLEELPKGVSIFLFILFASMLVLGASWYRLYIALLVGGAGYIIGGALAKILHLTTWYLALPLASFVSVLAWPITAHIVLSLTAVLFALGVFMLARTFALFNVWLGALIGFVLGVIAEIFFKWYTRIVFFATLATCGTIVFGNVVFSLKLNFLLSGSARFTYVGILLGGLLFILSVLLQVFLEPYIPDMPVFLGSSKWD